MDKINFGEIIKKSYHWMYYILFKTFSWKKWLVLLIAMFLSNNINSCGGGGSINLPIDGSHFKSVNEESSEENINIQNRDSEISHTATSQDGSIEDTQNKWYRWFVKRTDYIKKHWINILLISLTIIIPIVILAIWLIARFEFIWYHNIVHNEAGIVPLFKKYRVIGNSLFQLYLIFNFGMLLYTILTVGLGFLLAYQQGVFADQFEWVLAPILIIFAGPLLLLLTGTVVYLFLGLLIYDIVIPLMAQNEVGFAPAIQKCFQIIKENWKKFIVYFIVRILSIIIAQVGIVILSIINIIIIAIPALIFIGIPYWVLSQTGDLKMMFWIMTVITGLPIVTAFIVLSMSIQLPFSVFFRTFSIVFLEKLKVGYEVALEVPDQK